MRYYIAAGVVPVDLAYVIVIDFLAVGVLGFCFLLLSNVQFLVLVNLPPGRSHAGGISSRHSRRRYPNFDNVALYAKFITHAHEIIVHFGAPPRSDPHRTDFFSILAQKTAFCRHSSPKNCAFSRLLLAAF